MVPFEMCSILYFATQNTLMYDAVKNVNISTKFPFIFATRSSLLPIIAEALSVLMHRSLLRGGFFFFFSKLPLSRKFFLHA
jgi:hypothetical protein